MFDNTWGLSGILLFLHGKNVVLESIARNFVSTDWIVICFLLALLFLVLAKWFFPQRFDYFVKLSHSDRYFQYDRGATHLTDVFGLLLYAAHAISVSLFIYISLSVLGFVGKENPKTLFVQVLVVYILFFSLKYFFEKILGEVFKMEKTIANYLFSKISYRNYMALLLLPVTLLFVFAIEPERLVVWIAICFFLLLNLFFLFVFYRKNRKMISANWFYFILYLCAFEIAPYFILCKAFEIA